MKRFARICSTIFHPLILPLVGIFISLYFSQLRDILGNSYILNYSFVILFFTFILPCFGVLLLYKTRLITSVGLVKREERTLPYLLFFMCYISCNVFIWWSGLRGMQFGFMTGGLIAILIDVIVNKWWKISVHMTAIGGVAGLIFAMSHLHLFVNPPIGVLLQIIVILGAGALGTARITLKRHTLGQVCCGFLSGAISVFASCLLSVELFL